jgi:hypothetical protein
MNNKFINVLYNMLIEENKSIISWMYDNESIIIYNKDLFIEKILPKYFRHSKIASFNRQLNNYGFKINNKGNTIIFNNIYFRKNNPELLNKIKRKGTYLKNTNTLEKKENNEIDLIINYFDNFDNFKFYFDITKEDLDNKFLEEMNDEMFIIS